MNTRRGAPTIAIMMAFQTQPGQALETHKPVPPRQARSSSVSRVPTSKSIVDSHRGREAKANPIGRMDRVLGADRRLMVRWREPPPFWRETSDTRWRLCVWAVFRVATVIVVRGRRPPLPSSCRSRLVQRLSVAIRWLSGPVACRAGPGDHGVHVPSYQECRRVLSLPLVNTSMRPLSQEVAAGADARSPPSEFHPVQLFSYDLW